MQPAIPQNPTPLDAKTDLLHKRIKLDPTTQPVIPGIKPGSSSGGNNAGAGNAANGNSNSSDGAEIKPLVKHVLSKELQMYYERITSAVLSQDEVLRATGISSLQNDPGLHQLLPYFVQLVAEKVNARRRCISSFAVEPATNHTVLTDISYLLLVHVGDTKHKEFACTRCNDVHGSRASGKQQSVYRAICKAGRIPEFTVPSLTFAWFSKVLIHLSLGFLLIVAPTHADYFDMCRRQTTWRSFIVATIFATG